MAVSNRYPIDRYNARHEQSKQHQGDHLPRGQGLQEVHRLVSTCRRSQIAQNPLPSLTLASVTDGPSAANTSCLRTWSLFRRTRSSGRGCHPGRACRDTSFLTQSFCNWFRRGNEEPWRRGRNSCQADKARPHLELLSYYCRDRRIRPGSVGADGS